MIRNFTLLFIIFLEQFGIAGSWTIEPPKINYQTTFDDSRVYIEDISPLPEISKDLDLSLRAKAYIVIDKDTAMVLAEKNINEVLPMASLTKIMTAILVLENADLQDVVTISQKAVSAYGAGIDLRSNEHLTVEELLYAALLNSSNDAAVALAEHIAGTEIKFVDLMNERAEALGLSGTTFKNSTGLDEDSHLSNVEDLTKLSRYALLNDDFSKIVATDSRIITSKEGIRHYLTNSNKLMGGEHNIKGVKTGYTDEAGECLITLAQKDNREILAVVLGSEDRFSETSELLKWSFDSYKW